MTLILITGPAGSGKTTSAKYIQEKTESDDFALADDVKKLTFLACKLYDVPINSLQDLYDISTKNKYRKYMQGLSTECCKTVFGENFWCKVIKDKVLDCLKYGHTVTISDIRFRHEIQFFRNDPDISKYKIYCIKIERDCAIGKTMTHSSETEMNTFQLSPNELDEVIYNNFSLQYLYVNLDRVLEFLHLIPVTTPQPNAIQPPIYDETNQPLQQTASSTEDVDQKYKEVVYSIL